MGTSFNPRSREGSDKFCERVREALRVSIHAPVKGATVNNDACADIRAVSIHAPVKGATVHARTGETSWHVSIHAPVKGATLLFYLIAQRASGFNPRSREGSDDYAFRHGFRVRSFNPRSREGSDMR